MQAVGCAGLEEKLARRKVLPHRRERDVGLGSQRLEIEDALPVESKRSGENGLARALGSGGPSGSVVLSL